MHTSKLHFPALACTLALLACCVLLPGLGGGFIFDDSPNILHNANLQDIGGSLNDVLYAAYSYAGGKARSLSMLSLSLDFWRAGLNPQAFKVTNLAIHALTVLALTGFFRLLLLLAQWPTRRANVAALLLTALWAFHPLQVSSVLYIVQRMQTLCTLFVIAALWAYLAMRKAQIQGKRSRHFGLLALLFAALGFASKEDAILLPAYALALELTVLRFQAAQPALAARLQRGYLLLTLTGLAAYLLLVVPHYWSWTVYPSREFSSYERLLTQGRVLTMYLSQSLLPLPGSMPFYYDDYVISRGWLQPPGTLLSWLLLACLLAWAWRWRIRRPLFSLGIFLFFSGHFITSNVFNLELAFEHRNHFPLIGVVLAAADLCMAIYQRYPLRLPIAATILALLIGAEVSATAIRAHTWGDPLRLAKSHADLRPNSTRAWLGLCGYYFEESGKKAGPLLDKAIATCQQGAELTDSPSMYSNVVIFKTIRGDTTQNDWAPLLAQLRSAPMNSQNKGIALVTLTNIDKGVPLDERGVLQTLDIISQRTTFAPHEYLRMGAYIHNRTHQPNKALPYLRSAVEHSPPDDPAIAQLLVQLKEAGREDWVNELSALQRSIHE